MPIHGTLGHIDLTFGEKVNFPELSRLQELYDPILWVPSKIFLNSFTANCRSEEWHVLVSNFRKPELKFRSLKALRAESLAQGHSTSQWQNITCFNNFYLSSPQISSRMEWLMFRGLWRLQFSIETEPNYMPINSEIGFYFYLLSNNGFFPVFLVYAIFTDVRWYLTVILISISLTSKDKHFFICLLV